MIPRPPEDPRIEMETLREEWLELWGEYPPEDFSLQELREELRQQNNLENNI